MASSRFMAAQPGLGSGFEFDVLIATLLGGTSLLGGEGSVVGLLLGALIVGSVTTGLNMLGVPSFIQTVMLGAVLIAAVGFDAVVRSRRGRAGRRQPAMGA
jgi:ribose/xylose/arabinose/galactoside ABC-type transport system permease subunit